LSNSRRRKRAKKVMQSPLLLLRLKKAVATKLYVHQNFKNWYLLLMLFNYLKESEEQTEGDPDGKGRKRNFDEAISSSSSR
jgi:hypothetical protein